MILIYICAILVSMIKIISCVEYVCPSFYPSSDGSLQARMEVPTPNNHNNVIKFNVELSIGSSVSNKDINYKLLFLGSTDDIINKRQLVFTLELPSHWNKFKMKITSITTNDEKFCLSSQLDNKNFKSVTKINLIITLKITNYNLSSDNKKPIPTLPSISNSNTQNNENINNNYYMTQSPNNPITTRPIHQNFQFAKCYKSSLTIPLINHGDDAENGKYPWIGALVTIENQSQVFKCGATLITVKLALTAGHCVFNSHSLNKLYLFFGTNNFKDWFNDESQFRKVIKSTIHPQYNDATSDADIAILELSRNLYITLTVRPICLCNFQECFQNSLIKRGVVAGWGRTEKDQPSNTLKQIYTGIVTEEDCLRSSEKFYGITSNRTFCAGDKNGKGPCDGDSGSGFYLVVKGVWTIKGIVSRALRNSDGLCDLSDYIVYVDVAQHLNWIYTFL